MSGPSGSPREKRRDSLGDSPQHRVRERNGPFEARAAHELDRLVHGGVARHAAEVAELVRAEAQRCQHRRIELSDRALPERLDRMIERAQALHRAERELARERPVAIVEALRGGAQRAVGVGAFLGDAPEDVVGGLRAGATSTPQAAEKCVVRHALAALRLHLLRHELAFLSLARQIVTGRPCSSPRAPMCGESARIRFRLSTGRERSSTRSSGSIFAA